MADTDEYKRRIAKILDDAPWERSKSCQQKAEREQRAIARKARREKKPLDRPLEWHEQREVCKWLKKNRISFFAPVPEAGGGDVDPARMNALKAIGMRAGIPDLILVDLAPCDGRPTVIEMKRTRLTKSSLTPAQREWERIFNEKGWHHVVGIGADDAICKIMELGYKE